MLGGASARPDTRCVVLPQAERLPEAARRERSPHAPDAMRAPSRGELVDLGQLVGGWRPLSGRHVCVHLLRAGGAGITEPICGLAASPPIATSSMEMPRFFANAPAPQHRRNSRR